MEIAIILSVIVLLGFLIVECLPPFLNPDEYNRILYIKHDRYVHFVHSQCTDTNKVITCDDDFQLVKIPVSLAWNIRPIRRFCK